MIWLWVKGHGTPALQIPKMNRCELPMVLVLSGLSSPSFTHQATSREGSPSPQFVVPTYFWEASILWYLATTWQWTAVDDM